MCDEKLFVVDLGKGSETYSDTCHIWKNCPMIDDGQIFHITERGCELNYIGHHWNAQYKNRVKPADRYHPLSNSITGFPVFQLST